MFSVYFQAFLRTYCILPFSVHDIYVFATQDLINVAHRAHFAAHRAGILPLRRALRAVGARFLRIERQRKLPLPVKIPPGLAHLVIPFVRAGQALGDIRRVGGNFGGDNPLLYILHCWQPQVLGRRRR